MISKSTEYAIRAMVYVQIQSWKGKRPGVEEIAREIEAPPAFSAKILQVLTKHRLLDSMKGRGGGFFLREQKPEISLYDIIHVMEGDAFFERCGFGLNDCSDEHPCPLHDQYKIVRDKFYQIVKLETVRSLSEKIKNGTAVLNRITDLN